MAETDTDWRSLADDLEAHGVPPKRAEVVALVATGHSYSEIAERDDIALSSRGGVSNYVEDYREQLVDAAWLVEHAPDV
jgi:hypothetical protein